MVMWFNKLTADRWILFDFSQFTKNMNWICNPTLEFDHGFKSIGKTLGYGYIYTDAVIPETQNYGF